MYSACVFGCPTTTISPSREMSRPTEIMLVAMAQSTRCSILWNGVSSRRRSVEAGVILVERRGQAIAICSGQHRDLPARRDAAVSPDSSDEHDQDRYLMTTPTP